MYPLPRMVLISIILIYPGTKDDPEVKSIMPRPASPLGISDFVIHIDKLHKEKFAGVDHIAFSLLDGRVSSINIGYGGPSYSDVDQFVSKFVEGTRLPPFGQWHRGMDNLKIIDCKDFEVCIFAGGKGGILNYVLLKNLEADKQLKARAPRPGQKRAPRPRRRRRQVVNGGPLTSTAANCGDLNFTPRPRE